MAEILGRSTGNLSQLCYGPVVMSQTSFGHISINSHGLNGYGKPLKRPFNQYQSRFEAINNGQDIRQINW